MPLPGILLKFPVDDIFDWHLLAAARGELGSTYFDNIVSGGFRRNGCEGRLLHVETSNCPKPKVLNRSHAADGLSTGRHDVGVSGVDLVEHIHIALPDRY